MTDYDVDIAILGAGTAGMSAYREARKHTDRIALIDGGPLGTTCARVGCMPSKLLIAAADAVHKANKIGQFGIEPGIPEIDGVAIMDRVRSERDRFVGFVLEAVDGFNPDHLIRQNAKFKDDHTLVLGDGKIITARNIIIATGSRPNIPNMFKAAGDRLIVNDDVFDWTDLPVSVAVFGAGVIGLELGQALHRLGVRVRLFGRDHRIGPLTDPEVSQYATRTFEAEIPSHWHADTKISNDGEDVIVEWTGEDAGSERFENLLVSTGRLANIDNIGLENTSLERDARGVPVYDPLSMRAGDSHIFIAGDATVDIPLLHEAADEGRIAGENAAQYPDVFKRARRTGLGIVFSDPQLGIAGASYKELMDRKIDFEIGEISYEDQGRARVMGVNKGLLRVYGEKNTGKFLGAEMIGPNAEHILHLLAWSIQSELTVSEMLQRPFYHPVLEEGVRSALRSLNHALGFGPNPPLRCIDCGPGA